MIPVYQPWLTALEKKYLNEAIDSSWISSQGYFVDKAEELFADFLGVKHCIVTTSGTTALHLCLRALDLPHYDGDTRTNGGGLVAVPDTTFVATAFAASYDQRMIDLVPPDLKTWNMDIDYIEKRLKDGYNYHIIIPVHLYGNPCDMERLKDLQTQYGFKLVEDACESIGATINGKMTGGWSDIACFSFYGNKTFTTGEGGAVVTDNDELAHRTTILRGQAQDVKRYYHIDIGYNYRMTNMQAAIMCGQLERADEILAEKERVADRYLKNLSKHFELQTVLPGHKHSNWLVSLKLPVDQPQITELMRQRGIDTRKIFYPLSTMPPYQSHKTHPAAEEIARYGLSLPSFPQLTNKKIDLICKNLLECVKIANQSI